MRTTDDYIDQIDTLLDAMATDTEISDAALDAAFINLAQRLTVATTRLRFTGRTTTTYRPQANRSTH